MVQKISNCHNCGKTISGTGKSEYCNSCYQLVYPRPKKFGKDNPNYKDGRTKEIHYCSCGKQLVKYTSRNCSSCHSKELHKTGVLNKPSYKGIDKLLFCKVCSNPISYATYKYGKCRCASCATKEQMKDPRNNPFYIDGSSKFKYTKEFSRKLKLKIRKRDNFVCMGCHIPEKVYGKSLDIHHIDYVKENCNEDNLISLCRICNILANRNRDYWKEFYTQVLQNGTENK